MRKQNCWEFMQCGREAGGTEARKQGVCPAFTFTQADGFCDGTNGGRACVYITGTFCGGNIQGTFRDKEKNCRQCEFYNKELIEKHGAEMTVLSFLKYIRKVNVL